MKYYVIYYKRIEEVLKTLGDAKENITNDKNETI